jgi:peptidoglycan/LPS O-acetylase OafA/YrhL
VVIFFLLSGYLISQTLHRRLADPNSRFIDYAIDRWSRIYSGFLPAILVVAAMDYVCISHFHTNPETIERFTLSGFFANLAMLQAPAVALPFGSAAPFWTVAIEFWIYMFVGLIAFATRNRITIFTVITIVAIFLTGIIPVQSLTDNNAVLAPWLLGAACERLISSRSFQKVPNGLLWIVAIVALCLLAYHVAAGERIFSNYAFALAAMIFAPAIATFSRTNPSTPKYLESGVKWWVGWSYSLYLLHHSILMFVATAMNGSSRVLYGVAASIIASILFASVTEAHHLSLASHIKSMFRRGRVALAFPANR